MSAAAATRLVARWTPLALSTAGASLSPALIRSSHCLAVVSNHAYIFAGELKPRTPVPADLHIIGLLDGSTRILPPSGTWPAPRVGSSLVAVGSALYLWGGRGGKDMGTFGAEEDLWRFDTVQEAWEIVKTVGEKPEQRSFHVMQVLGETLYLHAGCPPKGRLATLHSLSLRTLTWSTLPTAPGPGRGGTVLASLRSGLLARFGGFAGFEVGGPLDLFEPKSGEWRSVEEVKVVGGGEGPGKRSVHSLVGVDGMVWEGKKVVALMAHGEREGAPAELGHDGAGFFHSDAWALLDGTDGFEWLKLEPSKDSAGVPEARGWFPSAFWEGNKVVMQGGLNERNERLGDGWVLEVVEE